MRGYRPSCPQAEPFARQRRDGGGSHEPARAYPRKPLSRSEACWRGLCPQPAVRDLTINRRLHHFHDHLYRPANPPHRTHRRTRSNPALRGVLCAAAEMSIEKAHCVLSSSRTACSAWRGKPAPRGSSATLFGQQHAPVLDTRRDAQGRSLSVLLAVRRASTRNPLCDRVGRQSFTRASVRQPYRLERCVLHRCADRQNFGRSRN